MPPPSLQHRDSRTPDSLLGSLSPLFPYQTFNSVQSACAPVLLQSDSNVAVAAPTGSGKTVLMELAMIRLFRDFLLQRQAPSKRCETASCSSCRAVYVCPSKALASEKYRLWNESFGSRGIKVDIETGDQATDTDSNSFHRISGSNVIVTTPERWDSLTRHWKEGAALGFVSSVSLVLIDEVHILSEERGAVLEAIVTRMKAIRAASGDEVGGTPLRFVAVSATVPNIGDIGAWLDCEPDGIFSFDAAERPVPLQVHVLPFKSSSPNPFAFERFLNFKLTGTAIEYGRGKSTLVFCSTRKECVLAATHVSKEWRRACSAIGERETDETLQQLRGAADRVEDQTLRSLIPLGVCFHHAALSPNDRCVVEDLFARQLLRFCCTTSTLAVGVNLPARLVLVKGTDVFRNGGREEMPLGDIAQMTGRAGRPGLDTEGVAVILTRQESAGRFAGFEGSNNPGLSAIESQLPTHMIEHVNAEIVLRTVHHTDLAVDWLKTTYSTPQHFETHITGFFPRAAGASPIWVR